MDTAATTTAPLPHSSGSGVALRLLSAAAADHGVPLDDFLENTGVTERDLDSGEVLVAPGAEFVAIRNTLRRGVDPTAFGLDAGLRASLTGLGLFGFAAMSSPNLRGLIRISLRYFSLTGLQVDIALEEHGDRATLTVAAEHLPADVRHVVAIFNLAGIVATVPVFATPVFEAHAAATTVHLLPEDAPLAPALASLPFGRVDFASRARRIVLPVAALDAPLPHANQQTQELCLQQCEDLLQRSARLEGVSAQVRALLVSHGFEGGIAAVADAMAVHPRTLRRRLADEGTTFRDLLAETRCTLAVQLLAEVGLTVDEVARRLGYAESASFSRAFSGWTGEPPSHFRR